MFELRWFIKPIKAACAGEVVIMPGLKKKVLQFRQRSNIEEIGIQPPIWTEWEDVPTEESI